MADVKTENKELVMDVSDSLSLWENDYITEGTIDCVKVDSVGDGIIYHKDIPDVIKYLKAVCEKYNIK